MKSKFIPIIKVFTSLSLLFICFTLVDYTSVFIIISNQSKTIVTIASILIFFTIILAAYRWKIICKNLQIQIDFKQILSISLFSNFVGQVLPGGSLSGEITKVFLSNSKTNTKFEILKSVIYDKLFGLMVAFLFFLISFIYISYLLFSIIDKKIFYFFFIILLISIFLLLNFRKNISEFFKRKKINLRIFKKDCLYSCLIISLIIYFLVFSSFLLLCFENISVKKFLKFVYVFQ